MTFGYCTDCLDALSDDPRPLEPICESCCEEERIRGLWALRHGITLYDRYLLSDLRVAWYWCDPKTDGTMALLKECDIPVTRDNYLLLAFAGDPPLNLDGEMAAELGELPEELQ